MKSAVRAVRDGLAPRARVRAGAQVVVLAVAASLASCGAEAPTTSTSSDESSAPAAAALSEVTASTELAAPRLFPERPHIVVVMVDTLRRDRLGAYGHTAPTSPFLDELARDGLLFEQAFSQASQTSVSTSTFFTSRVFPYTSGKKAGSDRSYSIAMGNLTVAELFAEEGYETYGIFTNPHHFPESGYWQGFDDAIYIKPNDSGVYSPHPYGLGSEVVDTFAEWADAREAADRDAPFYAYLHFMDVHNPYEPPEDLAREFVKTEGRKGLYTNGIPVGDMVPTDADLAFMTERYDAGVRAVDQELQRLIAALTERGLWKDTVLVLTSDHGDEFMEHGGLGHGQTLENEMIAIPLLLVSGHSQGQGLGRRVSSLVRNLDVGPTLLDLAGLDVPEEFQGRSLKPLLEDARVESGVQHSFAWYGPHRSLTTDRWHFVWNHQDQSVPARLYDRHADPQALDDVAAMNPEVVAHFLEQAEHYADEFAKSWHVSQLLSKTEGEGASGEQDPEISAQLEALGYTGN